MKIKLSKFWCLILTLVVVLSMGMVFAVPAAANEGVTASPTVTILYPTDGAVVSSEFGTAPNVINGTATAVEEGDVITQVKVQISRVAVGQGTTETTPVIEYFNGSTWDTNDNWFTADGTTTWTDTSGINASNVIDGYNYTVEADVTSNDGTGQTSIGFTYNTAPEVWIYGLSSHQSAPVPQEGTADNFPESDHIPYLNGPAGVSGGSKDYKPGTIAEVQIKITDSNGGSTDWITAYDAEETGDNSNPNYNYQGWGYEFDPISDYFPQDGSMDGVTYTITARAYDNNEQVSEYASRSFILDTTPPEITFTAPTLPEDGTGIVYNYITGKATDAGAGIWQWGAVAGDLNNPESYTRYGDSPSLNEIQWLYQAYGNQRYHDCESYTLTIYVMDKAGNIGYLTSNPFTFKRLQDDDKMYLSEGWNFISVPAYLAAGANTFGEIFDAQGIPVTAAYAYDPSNPDSPWVSLSEDSPINPLDGYWVKVDIYKAWHINVQSDFVDTEGHCVDYVKVYFSYADAGKTPPPTKTVYANAWNAIGVSSSTPIKYWQPSPYDYSPFFDGCQLLVQDQLSSIMDGWSVLLGWNRYQQQYVSSIFNNESLYHGFPKIMLPGSGYWIFISKDNNDVYSAVCNGIQSGGGGPP